MTVKFTMVKDINGYNGFGLQPTDVEWQGILTANSAQTITIPESTDPTFKNLILIFSFDPGSSIWVAYNNTPTTPTGTIVRCNSSLNPTSWLVKGGDTIGFITNDTSDEYGAILYAF